LINGSGRFWAKDLGGSGVVKPRLYSRGLWMKYRVDWSSARITTALKPWFMDEILGRLVLSSYNHGFKAVVYG